MSISSGIDWFDLNATVRFGAATASLPDVLTAVRSVNRSSGWTTDRWA